MKKLLRIFHSYDALYLKKLFYASISLILRRKKANENYNYTICIGSYPQIIHKPEANVTGGTITCEEFVDANGKGYNDWIPAIKLYSAEVASASSNITNDMDYARAGAGGGIEPSATDITKAGLYNSYNSAVNRLFKALKSIGVLYFYFSNHEITQIFTRDQ
jgi:hypothetical protein